MDPQVKGALIGGVGTAAALSLGYLLRKSISHSSLPTENKKGLQTSTSHLKRDFPLAGTQVEDADEHIVLLGDVGGTNIRLILANIHMSDRDRKQVIQEKTVDSRSVQSFEEAVKNFLKEFEDSGVWPSVAVVGIAGPVDNNSVEVTNCAHWPPVDGQALSQSCNIPKFMLLNDFAVAGLGILNLKEMDFYRLTDIVPHPDSVKMVIGPGTGLGQGFLTKSEFASFYEVYPSEGGHSEFSVRSQEDFELLEFATTFIEKSDNVENLRAKGKINRVSIERLCAGPAVPLIYDFMRTKYPDLERVLEKEGFHFNQLTSPMIIEQAMKKKDPLCLKVVDKFAEIYGVEVGNMALSVLPYGGIYLIGGVTSGISEHLLHSDIFLNAFYQKGRQEKKLRKMPIFLVKKEIQVGLLGAEEQARRLILKLRNEKAATESQTPRNL